MLTRPVSKINMSLNKMVFVYKDIFNKTTIKIFLTLSCLQSKAKMVFGNEVKTYQNTHKIVFLGDQCPQIKIIFLGVVNYFTGILLLDDIV